MKIMEKLMNLEIKCKKADNGYAALIGGVVAVLVTILVGILVYFKVAANMGLTQTTAKANAASVNTTASTVFALAPIVGIVMIASIILLIVTNFGKGGQ